MGREVGGGFRMGNTCKSMAIHVNVWQKPLQYCKIISLQLIQINEKQTNNNNNKKIPRTKPGHSVFGGDSTEPTPLLNVPGCSASLSAACLFLVPRIL